LIYHTQEKSPNIKRILAIDIGGHEGRLLEDGRRLRWDQDMMEFQFNFLGKYMIKFLSELYTPLWHVRNKKMQINDVPKELMFIREDDSEGLRSLIKSADEIYYSSEGVTLRTNNDKERYETIEVIDKKHMPKKSEK
jgi:hypothetical protein